MSETAGQLVVGQGGIQIGAVDVGHRAHREPGSEQFPGTGMNLRALPVGKLGLQQAAGIGSRVVVADSVRQRHPGEVTLQAELGTVRRRGQRGEGR